MTTDTVTRTTRSLRARLHEWLSTVRERALTCIVIHIQSTVKRRDSYTIGCQTSWSNNFRVMASRRFLFSHQTSVQSWRRLHWAEQWRAVYITYHFSTIASILTDYHPRGPHHPFSTDVVSIYSTDYFFLRWLCPPAALNKRAFAEQVTSFVTESIEPELS